MIDAGSRSGREWKCWTPFEPAGTIGSFIGLIVPNGTAMPKWKLPFVPPTTFSPVFTVTVSPARTAARDEAPTLSVGVGLDRAGVGAGARADDRDVADLARRDPPERDLGPGQRAVVLGLGNTATAGCANAAGAKISSADAATNAMTIPC